MKAASLPAGTCQVHCVVDHLPPKSKITSVNYNQRYHFMNTPPQTSSQKLNPQQVKSSLNPKVFSNSKQSQSTQFQSRKSLPQMDDSMQQRIIASNLIPRSSLTPATADKQLGLGNLSVQFPMNYQSIPSSWASEKSSPLNFTGNDLIAEKIIEITTKKIQEEPGNIKLYLKRLQQYLRVSQFDKAIEDAEFVLSRDPKNISALSSRGNAQMKLGRIEKALNDFEQVLRIDPDNVNAALTKASCLNLKGDYVRAIDQYEDALEKDFEKSSQVNLSLSNVKRSFKIDYPKLTSFDQLKYQSDEQASNNNQNGRNAKLNYLDKLEHEELQMGVSLMSSKKPYQLRPANTSGFSSTKKLAGTDCQHLARSNSDQQSADSKRGFELSSIQKAKSNTTSECTTPLLSAYSFTHRNSQTEEEIGEQANMYFTRGYLARQKGDFKTAIELYSQAITLKPLFLKAVINRGFLLDKLGEEEKAAQDYTTAIAIDNKCSFAYFNRGISFDKLGKWEEAIQDFSMAIRIDPTSSDFYLNRGNVLQKLEYHSEAIQDYTKCIDFRTDKLNAVLISRALSYEQSGDLTRAKNDYQRALELGSFQSHVCYSRLANICMNQGDLNSAFILCNKALEITPKSVYCLSKRAQICIKRQLYNLAFDDLTLAISLNPSIASIYFSRGKVQKLLGKLIESTEDSLIALHLQPQSPGIIEFLSQNMMELGEFDDALKYIDLGISMGKASEQALFNRSLCNTRLHRFEEAERDLKELQRQNPSSIKAQRALAICLFNEEKYKEAEEIFSKLLSQQQSVGDDQVELKKFRDDCLKNIELNVREGQADRNLPYFGSSALR